MFDLADDLQVVSQPSRLPILDMDLDDGVGTSRCVELRGLVYADRSDHVRTSAFHELEIVRIINDPVCIRVLEVDGECKMVVVAEEAATIGRFEVMAHEVALATGDSPRQTLKDCADHHSHAGHLPRQRP